MAHNLEILDGVASFAYARGALKRAPWWESSDLRAALVVDAASAPLSVLLPGARGDYKVRCVPLHLRREDGSLEESPHVQAVIREDTGLQLSGVGKRWNPAQNVETSERALRALTGQQDPACQTAGILDDGRSLFVQAAVSRTLDLGRGGEAEVRPWVAIHHYARRCDVGYSVTDIVCANTLAAAFAEAEDEGLLERVRHTGDVTGRIERAAERLLERAEGLEAFAAAARAAKESPLSREDAVDTVRHLWPATAKGTEEPTTAAAETHARVLQLASGVDLIGADQHNPGSTWSLYAAITQYLDREIPRRFSAQERDNDGLRATNGYLKSALGLDPRAQTIREEATQLLLGVG